MKPQGANTYQRWLSIVSNAFFITIGGLMSIAAIGIMGISVWKIIACSWEECNLLNQFLHLVSFLIISAAIFDVGRYLLEEEVFRDRELRSPTEARRSLTKFMVIIVIAVTLESLLGVIKASSGEISVLIYPSILFLVAVALLVGLGVYQRLSVLAEVDVSAKK